MLQSILRELRSELLERVSVTDLPDPVWKRTSALNTWGTNAIEGSTIGWKDAEKILFQGLTPSGKPVDDVRVTIQHEEAFRSLKKHKEMDLELVLELHEQVFFGVFKDAGSWRRINARITGAKISPPRMEKVRDEMIRWEGEYRRRDVEGEDTFTLGAWMHHEFERIHPFSDGNGRIGRLLLNLHFLNRNWPPVHILPKQRNEYIRSLNEYARDNQSVLEDLLKVRMASSLLDLLDQVGTSADVLISLKEASEISPYNEKYLALRCSQGELPGLREGREWRTSPRALELYVSSLGRK
ncbi:MAG: Fic family protein [Thermoplasmata archaeon]